MKKYFKDILEKQWFLNVVYGLCKFFGFIIYGSSKKIDFIPEETQKYINNEAPSIFVYWHNLVLMSPGATHKKISHYGLFSPSKDGTVLSYAAKPFKIFPIWGSSNKQGKKGFKAVLDKLEEGKIVAITPDGPRGPKYKVKGGCIRAASLSGCPIIPYAVYVKRCYIFNSWDNLMFPYPFNKLVFMWGEPIFIPENVTSNQDKIDEYKQLIEQELISLKDKAKSACLKNS